MTSVLAMSCPVSGGGPCSSSGAWSPLSSCPPGSLAAGQSTPRSILKRRRDLTADDAPSSAATNASSAADAFFSSPPALRSGGGRRAVRLAVPKKRARLSFDHLPSAHDSPSATTTVLPHSPDFDVFELEPMVADGLGGGGVELFGTRPEQSALARTPKQQQALALRLAADLAQAALEEKRKSLANGGQGAGYGTSATATLAEIRARRHFRGGRPGYSNPAVLLSSKRVGPPPPSSGLERTSQQSGMRRMGSGLGGFRAQVGPPVPQAAPARLLSKKELGLVARLEEANRERARMEADEREEQAATKQERRLPASVERSGTPIIELNSTVTLETIEAAAATAEAQAQASELERGVHSPPPPSRLNDDLFDGDGEIFSPRSDASSDDEADVPPSDVEVEDEDDSEEVISPDVDVDMEDAEVDAAVQATGIEVDEDFRLSATPEPHTPERVDSDPLGLTSFSESPLLLAPKKRRSPALHPLVSPSSARIMAASMEFTTPRAAADEPVAMAAPPRLPTRSKAPGNHRSSVRRSLLSEMEDEVSVVDAPSHALDSMPPTEGLTPVQALLATIQRDAADAILFQGRVYVPLPPAASSTSTNALAATAAAASSATERPCTPIPSSPRHPLVRASTPAPAASLQYDPTTDEEAEAAELAEDSADTAARPASPTESVSIPESPVAMDEAAPAPVTVAVAAPVAAPSSVAAADTIAVIAPVSIVPARPRSHFSISFECSPMKLPSARSPVVTAASTSKSARVARLLTRTDSPSSMLDDTNASAIVVPVTPKASKAPKAPRRKSLVRAESAPAAAAATSSAAAIAASSSASAHTPPAAPVMPRAIADLYDSLTGQFVPVGPRSARRQKAATSAAPSSVGTAASSPSKSLASSRKSFSSPSSSVRSSSGESAPPSSFLLIIAPDGKPYQIQNAKQMSEFRRETYDIQQVVAKRMRQGRPQWLVRWLHWPKQFNSWEPRGRFLPPTQDPDEMLKEYLASHPNGEDEDQ